MIDDPTYLDLITGRMAPADSDHITSGHWTHNKMPLPDTSVGFNACF